jgi:hypothetical protein
MNRQLRVVAGKNRAATRRLAQPGAALGLSICHRSSRQHRISPGRAASFERSKTRSHVSRAGHGKRNPRGRRCSALAEQDSPPMPPLNATLWMLLIASLVALFGWGVVRLTGRIERQRRTHGMTKDSR